jgi:hypothetical protein
VARTVAREVKARCAGQLGARSLHDPEIQARLDRARPGWRWEPMLLEVERERVRVFAGLGMRARLVQVLGPVRALRVAQAVARHGGPVLGVDWGRRDFLRRATGALAGWIALRGLGRPVPAAAASPTPPTDSEGELWEGFLLLPPGTPIPRWVQHTPAPILCQTADPQAEAELRGDTHPMEPLEAWLPRLNFPLYSLLAHAASPGPGVPGGLGYGVPEIRCHLFGLAGLRGAGRRTQGASGGAAVLSPSVSGVAGLSTGAAGGAHLSGEDVLHPPARAAAPQRPGTPGALDSTKCPIPSYRRA